MIASRDLCGLSLYNETAHAKKDGYGYGTNLFIVVHFWSYVMRTFKMLKDITYKSGFGYCTIFFGVVCSQSQGADLASCSKNVSISEINHSFGVPAIPIEINKKSSYAFVGPYDSYNEFSSVTSGLVIEGSHKTITAPAGRYEAPVVAVNELKIGNLEFGHTLGVEFNGRTKRGGWPQKVTAIIGADLLKDFILMYDSSHDEVALFEYQGAKCPDIASFFPRSVTIPLDYATSSAIGRDIISVEINGVSVRVRVSYTSNHSVLNWQAIQALGIRSRDTAADNDISLTSGGIITGKRHKFDNVSIGGIALGQTAFDIAPEASNSFIGYDIMSKFDVIMDFPNGRMVVALASPSSSHSAGGEGSPTTSRVAHTSVSENLNR